MRTFLKTNPKGLHFALDLGRVKPLRILTLPCQKTKPKGLLGVYYSI